jgi:hypothetical protein
LELVARRFTVGHKNFTSKHKKSKVDELAIFLPINVQESMQTVFCKTFDVDEKLGVDATYV